MPIVARRSLALPIERLGSHYPTLVVGSGYGGAVVAARLAERGARVCVLERGREWHPGEFPTDEVALAGALRNDTLNPLGLLDVHAHAGADVDVIGASGLGGTSLINAAIALRPENVVFEQPEWPGAIRSAHHDGSLAECYQRAERMLGAAPQTATHAYAKSQRHLAAVTRRGVPHGVLPLNMVHDGGFSGPNAHGVEQRGCIQCGDCCSGCNVGAKNTLATNYLPHAVKHGAEIFTGIEVRWVARDGDRWALECWDANGAMPGEPRVRIVTADRVVLAAGSAGSSEILLRSSALGLRLSPALGTRFSANADVMGFAYNGDEPTNVVARHNHPEGQPPDPPVGPIITVFADHRGERESTPLSDRFLLLEGAVPSALAPLVAGAFATWAMTHFVRLSRAQLGRVQRDLFRRSFLPDGAINRSMLYLACGHDDSAGRYELTDPADRAFVRWSDYANARFVKLIHAEMEAHARLHGAIFFPNPRSTVLGGHRLQVTHPLGGCPMGDDVDRGVVDGHGHVFARDGVVHEGLYVVDAAIVPRSLGVTPLLTIAALAEHCAAAMAS